MALPGLVAGSQRCFASEIFTRMDADLRKDDKLRMKNSTKEQEKISLLIPCYNEQDALPFFYREAAAVLGSMPYDYEMIFINDGSGDQTLAVVKELAKKDPHVRYLSFSRNFGKEAAMYAGFCHAQGDRKSTRLNSSHS